MGSTVEKDCFFSGFCGYGGGGGGFVGGGGYIEFGYGSDES